MLFEYIIIIFILRRVVQELQLRSWNTLMLCMLVGCLAWLGGYSMYSKRATGGLYYEGEDGEKEDDGSCAAEVAALLRRKNSALDIICSVM